ncbi:uncharacterized protein [Cicer arietinum]|uniref:uncharacterized protein n=1 Tax=Cicer arietinum TaxID=3827 RepID=UPI003CC66CE2
MDDPPPPERNLGEYGNRNRNRARLAIHNQPVTFNKFEVSPTLFRELTKIHFSCNHNEDANRHLTNVFELCETMKVDGCSEEGKRLRLFLLSLTDVAKEWLNSFPANSITTWDDLMQIFCNSLRPITRIMFDATTGGSLNYKIASEARKIIETMESNEQMMLYDRGGGSTSGILELNFMDGLAPDKEGDGSSKYTAPSGPCQIIKSYCNFCGGAHKNGACEALDDDEIEELEEVNFVSNNGKQNNPYSTTYNPVTTRSDKVSEQVQLKAEKSESTSTSTHSEEMATPTSVEEHITLEKEEERVMSTYAKFMKEILSKKRKIGGETVMFTEECSAILQRKLPPKLKDPGSFSIPCAIGNRTFGKALCDIGASVSKHRA